MTNKTGGYQSLIVYQQAVIIYDLTVKFTKRYILGESSNLGLKPDYRQADQMNQAARSGKQNIVEGSLERSSKLNINLNSVARASFGELLEDFKDYLMVNSLKLWDKEEPRVQKIRLDRSNETNWSNWTNKPEDFCNLMVTLISRENYLLDQLIRKLEHKFITEGGYSENLFRKRLENKLV